MLIGPERRARWVIRFGGGSFVLLLFLLLPLLFSLAGCGTDAPRAKPEPTPVAQEQVAEQPVAEPPVAKAPEIPRAPVVWTPFDAPPRAAPEVKLSVAHAATCLVGVSDVFPDLRLPDLQGAEQRLADLRGERLTVVLFWDFANRYALEAFRDMGKLVADRYSGDGVTVVAIEVGDARETVIQRAGEGQPGVTILCDVKEQGLGQVSTGRPPRIFLLDAGGGIVWFDLEYSRTTRRELLQAIAWKLREGGGE